MFGKFLCNMHYTRLRKTGTTDLRTRKAKKCRMPGCENPSRKHRWCSKHWNRIRKNGSPFDKDQAWVPGDFTHCVNCGDEFTPSYGRRRYCSGACATTAHLGPRPRISTCVLCGAAMDMTARGPSGRRKYRSATTCHGCKKPTNLRRFIPTIVERDGVACGICGDHVDLALAYPHPLSPSVDHAMPRSLGGADSIENFRLSHISCNVLRQNRVEVSLTAQ